jgi:hypothetical protein
MKENSSMSDQEWDVLEFVERFRNGEFDGQLGEIIESLSPQQIEDLHGYLLMEGESRASLD